MQVLGNHFDLTQRTLAALCIDITVEIRISYLPRLMFQTHMKTAQAHVWYVNFHVTLLYDELPRYFPKNHSCFCFPA